MSNLKEKNLDFFNKILAKNKEKERVQKKVIKPNNKYEFDDCKPEVEEKKKRGRPAFRTKEDKLAYSRAYNETNKAEILLKKQSKWRAEQEALGKEPRIKLTEEEKKERKKLRRKEAYQKEKEAKEKK